MKYNQEGWPPLIYSLFMISLATFLRRDSHPDEFPDEGSDIELHGYTFSLIFLASFIYYIFSI